MIIFRRRKFMLTAKNKKMPMYKMLKSGNAEQFFAMKGLKKAGQVILYKKASDNEIADGEKLCYFGDLWVRADFRKAGIGSKLVQTVLDRADKLSFEAVSLGVSSDNEVGMNWYKNKGFEDTGKTFIVNPIVPDFHHNVPIVVLKYDLKKNRK